MSIRPIDLQVLIPKTEEINKHQQAQQDKNQAGAEKFMLQFQEKIRLRQSKVQNSHKSEQEKITDEKKNEEKSRKKQNQNKNKEKNNSEEINDPTKGTLIDIIT